MNVAQIREVMDRRPFRPFTVRLSNGATYDFREPRDFGAPKNFSSIWYFGEELGVFIDPLHIVEIIDHTA
jgi:hypothetical protein